MKTKRVLNIVVFVLFWAEIAFVFLFSGCANQQPPGGGEEDKIPPKIKIISPKPGSLEYKGSSIEFEFDEYVDRRSFQDAFRLSPRFKGDVVYDWSGKSVEVKFPKPFSTIDANKTFVVTVNTSLKDIRGNPITVPVAFAFSTGNKIDESAVSGKVFNNDKKNISIFAYRIDEGTYDPTKNLADYQTESSPEGDYTLTNMAPGRYRIIAIDDDDKNDLYTTDRESFATLPSDIEIRELQKLANLNFYMKQINASQVAPELNTENYFKDSLNIVSSSVKNDYNYVLPDQSVFLFFNHFHPGRDELARSIIMKDENGFTDKPVLNWRNDSLVEIFPVTGFKPARAYVLGFPLKTDKDSIYYFNLKFRVISSNSYGDLKGMIRYLGYDSSAVTGEIPQVKINLESKDIAPVIRYSFDVTDTLFTFTKIAEADYKLFAFIDSKQTGSYYYGNPFPFEYSEPFFVYGQTIAIKGGWTVENLQLIFIK